MAMRMLVVGAGSIGGYYGGRLAVAGRDVTFLVRPARAETLKRDGLSVVSRFGDFSFMPSTVLKEEIAARYDVVLLSVKAYGLAAAMEDFAAAVGPETMVLPMLNGMRHMGALVERFGAPAVLGGTSYISTDLDAEGRVVQMGPLQEFVYGEMDGAITPRVLALQKMLSGSGFTDILSQEIVAFMWRKWVVLCAMGAITCLLRGTIGAVASLPEGLQTAHAIVDEAAAVAAAEGFELSAAELAQAHERMTQQGSPLTASMYRDLQKGAPVEVEQIIGDMLRRATAHGLHTPLLRAAYVQLRVYEDFRAK